jgi:hypothetical protein
MENASFRSIDGRCDANINEKFIVSGREDAMYRDVRTNVWIREKVRFFQSCSKTTVFEDII